jgi:hypothetical protein
MEEFICTLCDQPIRGKLFKTIDGDALCRECADEVCLDDLDDEQAFEDDDYEF